MLSQLDISQIFETLYNTPVSYIIFYYLIVFSIASIIKHVLNINVESLNSELSIFKIDKNSVPILLLFGGFGLIIRSVGSFNFFHSRVILSLVSSLIFILLLISIKEIQTFIQKRVLDKKHKRQYKNYKKDEERLNYYVEKSDSDYKFVTISTLLILYCLIFSFIEFGLWPMFLVLGLMISYTGLVLSIKLKEISDGLNGW